MTSAVRLYSGRSQATANHRMRSIQFIVKKKRLQNSFVWIMCIFTRQKVNYSDKGEEIKIIGIAKQIISHGSSHTVCWVSVSGRKAFQRKILKFFAMSSGSFPCRSFTSRQHKGSAVGRQLKHGKEPDALKWRLFSISIREAKQRGTLLE